MQEILSKNSSLENLINATKVNVVKIRAKKCVIFIMFYFYYGSCKTMNNLIYSIYSLVYIKLYPTVILSQT